MDFSEHGPVELEELQSHANYRDDAKLSMQERGGSADRVSKVPPNSAPEGQMETAEQRPAKDGVAHWHF